LLTSSLPSGLDLSVLSTPSRLRFPPQQQQHNENFPSTSQYPGGQPQWMHSGNEHTSFAPPDSSHHQHPSLARLAFELNDHSRSYGNTQRECSASWATLLYQLQSWLLLERLVLKEEIEGKPKLTLFPFLVLPFPSFSPTFVLLLLLLLLFYPRRARLPRPRSRLLHPQPFLLPGRILGSISSSSSSGSSRPRGDVVLHFSNQMRLLFRLCSHSLNANQKEDVRYAQTRIDTSTRRPFSSRNEARAGCLEFEVQRACFESFLVSSNLRSTSSTSPRNKPRRI